MAVSKRKIGTITAAIETTLAALTLDDADTAAAELARKYAAAIDALEPADVPRLIGTIGPSLLKALEALGATPAARGKVKASMSATLAPVTPLERIRANRRQ